MYIAIQITDNQQIVNKISFDIDCFYLMRIGIKFYENWKVLC